MELSRPREKNYDIKSLNDMDSNQLMILLEYVVAFIVDPKVRIVVRANLTMSY